jgi:septal ring factor EnvC (AmiA/AmiB activator)
MRAWCRKKGGPLQHKLLSNNKKRNHSSYDKIYTQCKVNYNLEMSINYAEEQWQTIAHKLRNTDSTVCNTNRKLEHATSALEVWPSFKRNKSFYAK